ncbi:MAG: hypothetical protein PHH13_03225 [Candidatus Peribacteraceae bacterium]|nr:hypothetical protein [Candidatus Peribacteraceae bacterium]
MLENPLAIMFSNVGVFYGLIIPLMTILLLSAFFAVSFQRPGVNPKDVAQATYCYLMMASGILFMTIAALPTVTSVLAGKSYTSGTYFSLLLLFVVGGLLYLMHERHVERIDPPSSAIPYLLYFTMFKLIGTVSALLAALSLLLTITLGTETETGWWLMPVTILLYGLLLMWCTKTSPPTSLPTLSLKKLRFGKTATKRKK